MKRLNPIDWKRLAERRKEQIARATCPECKAKKGQPCIRADGSDRTVLHIVRIKAVNKKTGPVRSRRGSRNDNCKS